MQWLVWVVILAVMGFFGYRYYDSPPKAAVSGKHEIREAKATLMTKTKDHEALWIHYSYKDMKGETHEMSEKVPYIDVWEKLKIGQEIDILYDDRGLSVLKITGQAQVRTNQNP